MEKGKKKEKDLKELIFLNMFFNDCKMMWDKIIHAGEIVINKQLQRCFQDKHICIFRDEDKRQLCRFSTLQ